MKNLRKDFIHAATGLLIPLIFVFHNFNFYGTLLFTTDVFLLFLLYLLVPLLLYFAFRFLLRLKSAFAALVTTAIAIFFFFFGALQDFFLQYKITSLIGKTYVLPFLFLGLIGLLLHKKSKAEKLFKFISVAVVLFFVSEVIVLTTSLFKKQNTVSVYQRVQLQPSNTSADSINIYHIIFDSYTSSQALLQNFGFVNPIDSFLTEKGFFVAKHSMSNYNFTPYSLSSLFHLQYLNAPSPLLERNFKNYFLGNQLYFTNPLFSFFKQRGYSVNTFSILDSHDHLRRLGSFVPQTPQHSIRNQTFERVVLNPWLWNKLFNPASRKLPESIRENLRHYITYNEDAYQNVMKKDAEHQFNFSHFLLPHEPYAYLKPIDSLTLEDVTDHKNGYVKQVQIVNSLIQKIVPELQAKKNCIIVIQGDHGFRGHETSDRKNELKIFNAIYFPDRSYSDLHDSISLVNTYRIILNKYFQQQLPVLKDKYFLPHVE